MGKVSRRDLGAALGGMLVLAEPARAAAQARAAPAARPPATRPPVAPAPIALLAMLRSALLAVDHANRTGNYTVLRDLAGPQFREANTAARLAQIFGPVTAQGVDLLAVAVVEPTYTRVPAINAERMLHAAGVFRIPPRAAAFEVLWEVSGDQWRLFAIGIQPA